MNDILVALLGVFATVIVGLLAGLITMMRNRKGIVQNPPDPDAAASGQMAVSYWLREFDRFHEKLDEMIELLRDIQKRDGQ